MKTTCVHLGFVFVLLVAGGAGTAIAKPQLNIFSSHAAVEIGNDPGGVIAEYLVQVDDVRTSKQIVKFAGSCDSACTLFLSLPPEQLCLKEKASFRFHQPLALEQDTAIAAAKFLMTKYPRWIRNWIARHNGLSTTLITMDHDYASKYLRDCAEVASQ